MVKGALYIDCDFRYIIVITGYLIFQLSGYLTVERYSNQLCYSGK